MFPSLNPSSALVFHRFPICAWENFFPCRGEFLSPALRLFFPPAPRQFFPPALRNFFLPPRYQFFSILVKNVSPAPRRKFSSASVEIFCHQIFSRVGVFFFPLRRAIFIPAPGLKNVSLAEPVVSSCLSQVPYLRVGKFFPMPG